MRLAVGLLIFGWAVAGCGGGGDSPGSAAGTAGGTAAGTGTTGTGTGTGTGGGSGASSNAGPAVAQWQPYQTKADPNDTENDSIVQFQKPTKAGNTIWVVATVPDYAEVHTITVADSQGNTYTQIGAQINDPRPGAQSVAQFYATNIVGDSSTPDMITVSWGNDNYKGILAAEISGVTAASLVGQDQNQQDGLPAGTTTVTAGPITVASSQTPALLVSVSMNTTGGASDTGGSNMPGPAAGSGMTAVGTPFWDWGATLGTFASATVTSAESVSSVFNPPDTTDSYVTVAAVFH